MRTVKETMKMLESILIVLSILSLAVLVIHLYCRRWFESSLKPQFDKRDERINTTAEQVQSLRRLLRGVIVGDERTVSERASDVQQERREEQYGPVHQRIVQNHSGDYCIAFGGLSTNDLAAHLKGGLQVAIGGKTYTLRYDTVAGYTTQSLVIATSSDVTENAGDEEYPHLTGEAHERLYNTLAVLYNERLLQKMLD